MSSSASKPVVSLISPLTGANQSHIEVSRVTMMNRQALPPLQVKEEKEKQMLPEKLLTATSRREIMHLTAVSLGLAALLPPPPPAEARARNATMRQKIMQKFEELREKAGLSEKPKDEPEEEKKPKAELKDKSKVKETTVHPKEELSVPALPSIMNGKIIETTLP